MLSHNESILDALKKEIDILKSPEGYLYAGLPKFMGLFGRDALISGWQLLNYDPKIAKDSLLSLAKLQGQKVNLRNGEEPGKILHEFYAKNVSEDWFKQEKGESGWLQKEVPFYFSIDSTPLFIIIAGEYYRRTQDINFIRTLQPHLKKALNWILNCGMIGEFLRYGGRCKEEELISQSWKDGIGRTLEVQKKPLAIVEVQGYTFQAIKNAIDSLEIVEQEVRSQLEDIAYNLKTSFNQAFWMENENFYCLGIDGQNNQIRRITSNPGQLLFTDIIDKTESDLIVKRLFRDDMWTPYGIRTHSTEEPDFDPLSYQRGTVWPHDNWIIAEGLIKRGYQEEYHLIKEALLKAYKTIGFMPEYYGVSLEDEVVVEDLKTRPCYPQAWATGALLNLLTQST